VTEDQTALRIQIALFPDIILDRVPKLLKKAALNLVYMPLMRRYVQAVTKGFKYYIETGKQVRANQFGYNPLFSKRSEHIQVASRVRVGEYVNKSLG
jgi:hypothetical protein